MRIFCNTIATVISFPLSLEAPDVVEAENNDNDNPVPRPYIERWPRNHARPQNDRPVIVQRYRDDALMDEMRGKVTSLLQKVFLIVH